MTVAGMNALQPRMVCNGTALRMHWGGIGLHAYGDGCLARPGLRRSGSNQFQLDLVFKFLADLNTAFVS